MISRHAKWSVGSISRRVLLFLSIATIVSHAQTAQAQFGFGFNNNGGVVGGVSIDAEGVVRSATAEERSGWLADARKNTTLPAGELAEKSEMRMISLKKLQAEIAEAKSQNQPLSEEVLYLAGLQRVEYVFVYPESDDIVIAGPAEPWVVREDASVTGKESGRPVLQLEDLITAFRTVDAARENPISVSIDPTPEGEVRLKQLLSRVQMPLNGNPSVLEPQMRDAFGPQIVSLTTVAKDSRMASTLVAADYRMKRLAMGLESSAVAGMPSYLEMIRNSGASGLQPRWWIAAEYDAILHSGDMMAWKLVGSGVKALSEDEYVGRDGARRGSGKANANAAKWAKNFTSKFEDLCGAYPAFGDLRNVIDLNVVATIIRGHQLDQQAGCDLSMLLGSTELETPRWQTPLKISPEFSFVRGQRGWTITASGGVELNPFKVVSLQSKSDASLSGEKPTSESKSWWWN